MSKDELIDLITIGIARACVKETNGETVDKAAEIADVLLENGYRKSFEVALEVIEKMIRMVDVKVIGIEEDLAYGTAAHWDGIRRNCFEEILVEFAELKKKYTEGGK